jgi:hypothetical protein
MKGRKKLPHIFNTERTVGDKIISVYFSSDCSTWKEQQWLVNVSEERAGQIANSHHLWIKINQCTILRNRLVFQEQI